MRIMTALALAASLSLGTPALVMAQGAALAKETAQQSTAPKSTVQINKIQVIDVTTLPDAVKTQVNDVVSKTSEDDMKGLRASIDASPAAANALKEKGVSSAQVVAVNIADGVLTIVYQGGVRGIYCHRPA
jgi:hypothetical protein